MKNTIEMVKNSMGLLRTIACGLAVAAVGAISVGSSHGACVTQAGFSSDSPVSIGTFTPSTITVAATVVTTVGGTGCTNPPTLVGGTIRLDLCKDGVVQYSGTGSIAAGPGTQSQSVNVSVSISPKVKGLYNVVRTVVANFSDGSVSSYSYDCSGNPVTLRTTARKAASQKAPTPAKKQ